MPSLESGGARGCSMPAACVLDNWPWSRARLPVGVNPALPTSGHWTNVVHLGRGLDSLWSCLQPVSPRREGPSPVRELRQCAKSRGQASILYSAIRALPVTPRRGGPAGRVPYPFHLRWNVGRGQDWSVAFGCRSPSLARTVQSVASFNDGAGGSQPRTTVSQNWHNRSSQTGYPRE